VLAAEPWDPVLIIVCALLSAISISCCLFAVNVGWPFLGRTSLTGGDVDCSDETNGLDRAWTLRRRMYRGARWPSLVASFLFLIEFAHQTCHVFDVLEVPLPAKG
jgi:hypothetical protein